MPKNINDALSFIQSHDPESELLSGTDTLKIPEWIHTGHYLFNAQLSGDILKGVAAGRITAIAGAPKTGKSFLTLNIAREAQKMGYTLYFIETEGSPDAERLDRQGIDRDNMVLSQPITVGDVSKRLYPMITEALKTKKAGGEVPKIMIIIDSLSALLATKIEGDLAKGDTKTDMGSRAREIGTLFTSIATKIQKLGWPLIFTAHVYESAGMFTSETKMSGGVKAIYMASNVIFLSKKNEEEKEEKMYEKQKNYEKTRTGVVVISRCKESRFSIPKDIMLFIRYNKGMNPYIGLLEYCTWDRCRIDKGTYGDLVDPFDYFIRKRAITVDALVPDVEFDMSAFVKDMSADMKKYIPHYLRHMAEEGYIEVDGVGKDAVVKIKKKLAARVKDGVYQPVTGRVARLNPNAPTYVVGSTQTAYYQKDIYKPEIFTREVLEGIAPYVNAQYEMSDDMGDDEFVEL